MMRRIWYFLTDTRHLTIIGLTAMAALFYLGAQVLELALIWALAATVLMLLLAGMAWLWRRWRAKRESDKLGEAIGQQAAAEAAAPRDQSGAEVKAIRESMLKAIDTIKGSKMGIVSGTRALYELPWWLLSRTPALVREAPGAQLADAEYCLAMLSGLERVVDIQLGAEGPGFSAARDALQSAIRTLAPVGSAAALAAGGDMVADSAIIAPDGTPQNRAQALQQLRLVADFFRRTEPHSPVAYLADKAASWGDMPLHVWLRAVIKDPAAIAGLEELLGARPAGE